ncbi:hypothetical protein [Persicirhabdus sediminis]|uniref:Uncharacterized protein n=1 Tax=Persicirhabdus sediminis TaxID=454144 RepID=A0A8J7MAY4_9BACT|nr:hypothetical protein [Persicirhabdus sediminis]MBK1789698.1 hypothetical protein [Persicirhabdus sediminis]
MASYFPYPYTTGPIIQYSTSSLIDGIPKLKPADRTKFIEIMHECANFYGVKVLAYSILPTNFDLLLEHQTDGSAISDKELLKRMKAYGQSSRGLDEYSKYRDALKTDKKQAANILEKNRQRMNSVSMFMKSLKQRFSGFYNDRHQRRGTAWSTRYTNTIVQPGYATRFVAAYIEMAPLRQRLTASAHRYEWGSLYAAINGCKSARAGVSRIVKMQTYQPGLDEIPKANLQKATWNAAHETFYRKMVLAKNNLEFISAFKQKEDDQPEKLTKYTNRKAKPLDKVIRKTNMPHLTRGIAVGSEAFIESIFDQTKDYFGPKRKTGARIINLINWSSKEQALYAMRDIIGPAKK